jgi:hypothetical protein
MNDALGYQESFVTAVMSPEEGRVISGLSGSISAAVATAIYRNNILEGFNESLKNVYGAIFVLIGEDCFREIAYSYGRSIPSLSGDRNAFGEHMPTFLAHHPLTRELAYLPDMARLEWASHEAYSAAENFIVNGLHASLHLVESSYPLMALWQLCQHPDAEGTLDLDALGGDSVLIVRPQENVLMRSLSPGEAAWYRALLEGYPPDQAAAAARTVEPDCDPMLYWETAVGDGVLQQQH